MIESPLKAETARRLVAAIAAADATALGEIFTLDATIWHSTDQIEMSLPQLQGMLAAIGDIATADVEQTGLRETADGFLLTLRSIYQLASGGTTSFHAAQVVQTDVEGRITRIDEYLDGAGLEPLVLALAQAGDSNVTR